MKKRPHISLLPLILIALLGVALACGVSDEPNADSVPWPSDATPQSSSQLSASELKAVTEFVAAQEVLREEWEQFRVDFDQWRSGLTFCHESAAQNALREFAASFNVVTVEARDLPRLTVSQNLVDIIIAAVEAEDEAFRLLRDRWQPNNLSLFEAVEQRRTETAHAQRTVQDLVTELREELEEATDPERLNAIEELSEALVPINDAWHGFYDNYSALLKESGGLDNTTVLVRVNRLIEQLEVAFVAVEGVEDLQEGIEEASNSAKLHAIGDLVRALGTVGNAWNEFYDEYSNLLRELGGPANTTILARVNQLGQELDGVLDLLDGLAATNATRDMIGDLRRVAEAERSTLADIQDNVASAFESSAESSNEPSNAGEERIAQSVTPFLKELQSVIANSRAVSKEVSLGIEDALDGSAEDELRNLEEFYVRYERLIGIWDTFSDQYNQWRRTEGGCDRAEVIQSLGLFNLRISELSTEVRDLPKSGYLLPIYNLLVEAVQREEGAIRALRNSWRPFAVDSFIAVDRERDSTDGLRREASIALEELLSRP